MAFNLLDFVKDHRGLIGIVIGVVAFVAKQHGIEIDSDGVLNDILAAAALSMTAQQHVHLKAAVAASAAAAAPRSPGLP